MIKKIEILDRKIIRFFCEDVVTDSEGISTKKLKVILVLPTDNTDGLQDDVKAICAAVHTEEVIAAYQASIASES